MTTKLTQNDIKDATLTLQPDTKYVLRENLRVWQIVFGGNNITLNLCTHTLRVKTITIHEVENIQIFSSNHKPAKIPLITNDFGPTMPQLLTFLHKMRFDSTSRLSWFPKDIINLLTTYFIEPTIILDGIAIKNCELANFKIRAVFDKEGKALEFKTSQAITVINLDARSSVIKEKSLNDPVNIKAVEVKA